VETAPLETARLGGTGLEITRVGFGAWAIGGAGYDWGWGDQDDEESIAAIRRALELGVNWIDTAAQYGFGHSEQVVGRVRISTGNAQSAPAGIVSVSSMRSTCTGSTGRAPSAAPAESATAAQAARAIVVSHECSPATEVTSVSSEALGAVRGASTREGALNGPPSVTPIPRGRNHIIPPPMP
jgi:hypothetical protein